MKCVTENCKNEARHGRKICSACKTRRYRQKYPLKYLYIALKTNAMRRGKSFSLTLEEFSNFCKQTGYDKLKGKTALSLSIDRIRNSEGYSADNIRAITLRDNIKLRNSSELQPGEVCPF
jgi:hypothetical protein